MECCHVPVAQVPRGFFKKKNQLSGAEIARSIQIQNQSSGVVSIAATWSSGATIPSELFGARIFDGKKG
jgi:hypothetical protein